MFISHANVTSRKRRLRLSILFVLTLLLSISCGGGDGGGEGGGTSTISSVSAAAVVDFVAETAGYFSEVADYASDIGGVQTMMVKGLSIKGGRVSALSRIDTQQTTCDRGGSMDVQMQGLSTIIVTFSECRMTTEPDLEFYQDGEITITLTNQTDMSITFSRYIYRTTRISTNRIIEEGTLNYTLDSMLNSTTSCGGADLPKSSVFLANGTNAFKVDDDEDGTYDTDYTSTYRDFEIDMSFNDHDADCMPVDITMTFGGGIGFQDNIANETYTMDILDPDSLVMNMQIGAGGDETITVDGSFDLETTCFSGTVTVSTTTPIYMPNDADCPTSGAVEVTGDLTGTVTFTSSGGVQVDNGSDGTIDETYTSCDEAFEIACVVI